MNSSTIITKRLKKITHSSLLDAPHGSNGTYIQLSKKRGIKITMSKYPDKGSAIRSYEFRYVCKEADALRSARARYRYVPKCYGVEIVKIEDYYTIAIVLQHIGTQTLLEKLTKEEDINEDEIIQYVYKELRKRGIVHWDVHAKNIMFYKGRYWAIDFAGVYLETPRG